MSDTPALDHSIRAHARLAPSGADMWWHCPPSVQDDGGVHVERETVYAREGTAAHEMVEDCLQNNREAHEYIDRRLNNEFDVDEAWADAVQVHLDKCREYMGDGWVYWFERKVSLEKLNPPEAIAGTADFSAYHRETEHLVVVDFKFGKGIAVSVEANKQIKIYTLGVWLGLSDDMPVSRITNVVVQPRIPFGKKIKEIEVDALELMEWGAVELMDHAAATLDPNAPMHAGSWCRYCLKAGKCKEQVREAYRAAALDFDSMTIDTPASAVVIPEVRLMTPEQIAQALDLAPRLKAFLKQVEDTAKDNIERGTMRIPGWKVVQGEGKLQWRESDEDVLAEKLIKDFSFEDEKLWNKKLISFAKVRDALIADIRTAKKCKVKEAKEEAVALLSPLTIKSSSGSVLVPDSDIRSPVGVRGDEFASDLIEPPTHLSNT